MLSYQNHPYQPLYGVKGKTPNNVKKKASLDCADGTCQSAFENSEQSLIEWWGGEGIVMDPYYTVI